MNIEFSQGQIFRSQNNPEKDLKIAYISGISEYNNCDSKSDVIICWECANDEAFNNFVMNKLGRNTDTYPYSYTGECGYHSFKQRLSKHGLVCKDN